MWEGRSARFFSRWGRICHPGCKCFRIQGRKWQSGAACTTPENRSPKVISRKLGTPVSTCGVPRRSRGRTALRWRFALRLRHTTAGHSRRAPVPRRSLSPRSQSLIELGRSQQNVPPSHSRSGMLCRGPRAKRPGCKRRGSPRIWSWSPICFFVSSGDVL